MSDNNEAGNFKTYFNRHKNGLYEYALWLLADNESAADVVQEAFMKLFEKLNHNSEIKDIKSWLFITTRNLCLNMKRNSRKETSLDILADRMIDSKNTSDTRIFTLQKAMLALDTKFREVLVLKEYQGFSYAEMASLLETTVPAIKSSLYRARVMLRDKFNQLKQRGDIYGL